MASRKPILAGLGAALVAASGGCRQEISLDGGGKRAPAPYRNTALEIEYPQSCEAPNPLAVGSAGPRSLASQEVHEYWDMSLEEVLRTALENSRVFRDLGGRVLTAPTSVGSTYNPAIQESDPFTGVEAALSAFDANLVSNITWNRNERPANFLIPDGGGGSFFASILEQDLANFNFEVNKFGASGTQYLFRNFTNYEYNNNRSNRFPSVWNTGYEAEFRQPLLQGAGIEFNRIAGPNASQQGYNLAGFSGLNGVMITRINVDIALADFEAGVRDLVSNVENVYWDLYFAYRDLDAKVAGRDATLATWRKIRTLADLGARGGDPELEAQAREQYFRFQGQVEDALSGRRNGSTITGGNGGGGTFAGAGGVFAREANLRYIMGLPLNDGRMIRPKDQPNPAKMEFDWDQSLAQALTRRVELRRQKWVIRQRELQLVAARNFLMPRLDYQALYRWRGFGDHLWKAAGGNTQFDNAVEELYGGDYQEWQMGFQFSMPIGFRQAFSAVRNSEFLVARERAVLATQELSVSHDLGAAFRELERSYRLTLTNLNRRIAASQEETVVRAAYEVGEKGVTLDVLLDAQRRAAEADSDFHRSLVEYNLSIKGVHFEQGTLLDFNGIYLSEGAWPAKAYADARELSTRFTRRHMNYGTTRPHLIAAGAFAQRTLGGETIADLRAGHDAPAGARDLAPSQTGAPDAVRSEPNQPAADAPQLRPDDSARPTPKPVDPVPEPKPTPAPATSVPEAPLKASVPSVPEPAVKAPAAPTPPTPKPIAPPATPKLPEAPPSAGTAPMLFPAGRSSAPQAPLLKEARALPRPVPAGVSANGAPPRLRMATTESPVRPVEYREEPAPVVPPAPTPSLRIRGVE